MMTIQQSDPHKRGRASRDKGARTERALAALLNEYGFDNVHRGYTFHHESDVVGLEGIHVECKSVERLNIFKAMEQATKEAEKRKDGAPVVFHKRTRTGFLVTMRIQDWIGIYKDAMRWREHGKDK